MPKPARAWRAFYIGGREFTSEETAWEDLPESGVLGVVVYHDPPYRTVVSGGDWYYPDADGTPTQTDTHGTMGEWVDPPEDIPDDKLKRGEAVGDGTWELVQDRMMDATSPP